LMGGLLHLYIYIYGVVYFYTFLAQRGGARVGCSRAQSPPRCTKCISPPINGQCTNHRIAV